MSNRYYAVYRDDIQRPVSTFSISRETQIFARMNARNCAAILSGINNVTYEVRLVEKVKGRYVEIKP